MKPNGLAIRACQTTECRPILKLAATRCFWGLSRSVLIRLAKHLHIDVDEAGDLFATCWSLVQSVLESDDSDTLEILKLRRYPKASDIVLGELLGNPDAVELLALDDQREVKSMKGAVDKEEKVRGSFKQQWRERAQAVQTRRLKEAAACGKRKKKKKKKQGAEVAPGPLTRFTGPEVIPKGGISQAEAASMCPLGAHVWRNARGRAWCGHFPPHPRCSAQWQVFGHRQSALKVLQKLWGHFLEDHDLPRSACRVQGLFDAES